MAYDPKDPADKKIVDDAVAAALAEQAEAHEADVAGLKAKNAKLIADLKKAKAGEGGDDNYAEVERLEAKLAETQTALKAAEKLAKDSAKQLETVTGERDSLDTNLTGLLKDQGLTQALSEAKVDPKFLPAVKAMLGPKVALKLEGDERKAFVGDKSLGDFVKEWSQGDEGKAFISAGGNSGGGAGGSQGGKTGGKTMSRADYEQSDAASRAAFFAEGGTLTD